MKFIIFLSVLSFYVCAENYVSISKLGTNQAFQMKAECERVTGGECFDLGDLPQSIYSVSKVDVDDTSKPIWSEKTNTLVCSGKEDCFSKLKNLCPEDFTSRVNEESTEVYCAKVTGYEQKKKDIISLDGTKKAEYDASLIKKSQADAEEAKIQAKLVRMESGKRIIAFINIRNESKGLTKDQISQVIATYSDVKDALETGSLTTAKYLVGLKTPDGVVMTDSDKTAILGEIERLDK